MELTCPLLINRKRVWRTPSRFSSLHWTWSNHSRRQESVRIIENTMGWVGTNFVRTIGMAARWVHDCCYSSCLFMPLNISRRNSFVSLLFINLSQEPRKNAIFTTRKKHWCIRIYEYELMSGLFSLDLLRWLTTPATHSGTIAHRIGIISVGIRGWETWHFHHIIQGEMSVLRILAT